MGDVEVLALFRRAMKDNDAAAMREGLDQLLGLSDGAGLSAEEEYRVRHPDYVMEMPQTNERIRGRDAMRSMQEAFPTPPKITLRRVVGSGHVWVVEGVNDYDGDVWNVALILELDDHGFDRAGHALLRTAIRASRVAVAVGRTAAVTPGLKNGPPMAGGLAVAGLPVG